jgi:superfamily II DNA/RNA helicase
LSDTQDPDIHNVMAETLDHQDDQGYATETPLPPTGFADLGLSEPLLRAIVEKGYLNPTPIQEQAIPVVLMGRDVLGCAQTGTGKTAGFTLPMLDILSGARARARMPRALILEPTRELALQVAENFVLYGKYLKLTHALLIGGESMNDQRDALTKGVDVVIATPGRLIDLFERGGLLLSNVKVLVIDEADRMLDMGFIPDVERIVAMLPPLRQTLFFSATMAPEIKRLADAFLRNPKEITVSKPASVATTITMGLALVAMHDKREALRRLIRSEDVRNALIFCNRKRDVDILHKSLDKHKFSAGALHGDMAQSARFATLEKFKSGDIRLLVCSDVAARGLDIGGLSHVFNFDVPHHAEDYVHRIGRTGRAGLEGRAFTLATPDDQFAVEAIEKLTGGAIPRITIEGLDTVEWAERDSRGRRRRGPVKAPPKQAEKPARQPRRDKAPAAQSPADQPVPALASAPEIRAPRDRSERKPGGREQSGRNRPERARPEYYRQERGMHREKAEDNSVIGFGDDIPAFMLLRRHHSHAVPARAVPVADRDHSSDTDIAA